MSASAPEVQAPAKRWPGKRWIMAGSAVVVAVVAVLVIVIIRLRAPSLVTADKLDSMLLDAAQINTIIGGSELQIDKVQLTPGKPTSVLSKPECLGALSAAQAPTYADSGYTGLRSAGTKEPGRRIDHYVLQAAVLFPDADKATLFVKNSADQWKSCADQNVASMFADKSVILWKLGTVVGDPPQIAISETRRDVDWTCQRAMRAVSNVVVDATACGSDIADQGTSIAHEIATRISQEQ